MMYEIVYLLNLLFAAMMMAGTYWMANNEVNERRRKRLAFLSWCCTAEVLILTAYVPFWHPDYSVEMMTTLLFAKFVLKPGLVSVMCHDLRVLREKIERGRPHGQVSAVIIPHTLEQVHQNQEASAKGKLDEAVQVAHEHDSKIMNAPVFPPIPPDVLHD